MPSFTTIFRASIMLVTIVLAVKGWQLYGPSTAQVKSMASRALEVAQDALNNRPQLAMDNAGLETGQSSAASSAAPFAALPAPVAATADAPIAAPLFAASSNGAPASIGEAAPGFLPPKAQEIATAAPTASDSTPNLSSNDAQRLPLLLNRLEQLGGTDPQLASWGESGQLYRFCCRAALTKTPNFTRHFESVAAEPLAAVEKVVAQVEAWRTAQRDGSGLR